ncbi:MAG: iron-sulfur cluster carrier protein ApbC [Zetaproteobacteria bacterium]|nr:MAG: iron-sulfur cluster carrier protein ApbC [Zetaproteobacteria bacterium]
MLTRSDVEQALRTIIDPDLGRDIVSLGFVKNVEIHEGRVRVTIELTTPACPVKDRFRQQASEAISSLDGVEHVDIVMTSRVQGDARIQNSIPGIAHIVAVASGKGGVGKSTTAVNLAVAMAMTGARVGLLDADIYGPSIPRMMRLADMKPKVHDKTIEPLENYGVKTMSIGYMIREDQAMIWRGPMVSGAVMQLLNDVAWGELDYLFIDLPPGTGDIHLTLAQRVPMSGAIIVTTPQDIALLDARKAVTMFDKVHVPSLGIVENMSMFVCPHCGQASHIFAEGGAKRLSDEVGVPLLTQIPLDIDIRIHADEGTPITIARPDSKQAECYHHLAGEVARRLSTLQARKIDIPVMERKPGGAP